MAIDLLERFQLNKEKESFQTVYETINNGVIFRGTNLWVLIFAIFIASLGLNVNSPGVVIGAMLISPLMGPILGMGFSVAVNDLALLRKSLRMGKPMPAADIQKLERWLQARLNTSSVSLVTETAK